MKQPILNGILESPLDLNGFGFVNFGGLLGTFQAHSAVLDALAATSPSYVGLSILQLANPGSDSFLKIQSNGVPVYVAGSSFEVPLTFSAPLSRSGNTISLPVATGSVNGYLASADWTTFNSKATSAQGAKADSAVQSISIATVNGVSGSSSGGTTPALTLVLGAIVPTSVAASGAVSGSNLSGTNTGDQVVPSNTTATASNWFTAYNSTTGAFTKAQPTFTDLAAHPTTISGYGITDFNSLGDARWQPLVPNLTSWAAITRASGFDTFTATPSVANFKSLLSDETTVVGNLLSLANPSAISFIKIAADNTVSTRTPSQLLGDIAAEPALGNPGTTGFVLSSTTGGVRSWVTPIAGIDSDGNSIHLNPGGSNLANIVLSNPSAYARLVYDTTYVSVENGRINFVAADPPAGQGFRFNTYNVKFGTGGTVLYGENRIGDANLPLGAQLYDNAGTPKLALDLINRQALANDGSTVALDWSDPTSVAFFTDAITMESDGTLGAGAVLASTFAGDGSGLSGVTPKVGSIGSVIAGTKTATGTATTTFTVTIGVTMANTTYKVTTEGDNALSAAVHYVNNKTTTTFDIVYLAGLTGAVSVDWLVSP